jgi:signal transduction histidine kinase
VLESVSVDLRTLIEDSIEFIVHSSEIKSIELICNIDPETPDKIITDPVRLRTHQNFIFSYFAQGKLLSIYCQTQ